MGRMPLSGDPRSELLDRLEASGYLLCILTIFVLPDAYAINARWCAFCGIHHERRIAFGNQIFGQCVSLATILGDRHLHCKPWAGGI